MAASQSTSQTPVARDPVAAGLLAPLREELRKETTTINFTCGGTISITGSGQAFASGDTHAPTSEPVTIRWDPADPDTPASQARLVLPSAGDGQEKLKKLIEALEPASFGYYREDELGEMYDQGLKLGTDNFSSTFNPYECGIIDGIAQALLPSTQQYASRQGVRAELYELNAYPSSSGKFKPDIDTPRGSTLFGSLVVCLPFQHEGGQLRVRHKGREVTYDWGSHQDQISWAAFYSDCQHEVLDIKSGHCLTLTYHLHAVRGGGMLTDTCPPVLDTTQLPIYVSLKNILENRNFMPRGGYLGFYCSHTYPAFATEEEEDILPRSMLKGLDMVLWETLYRLGLTPIVHNELKNEDGDPIITDMDRALQMKNGGFASDEQIREWHWGETLDHHQVHWLTRPYHTRFRLNYMADGHEKYFSSFRSYCAITAWVKPSHAR